MTDSRSASPSLFKLVRLFLGLLLIVPVIAFSIVQLNGPEIRKQAFDNLSGIVALKANQIERWLDERRNDFELLAADKGFILGAERLALTGNADARAVVAGRLGTYIKFHYYHSAFLLSTSGDLVVAVGEHDKVSPVTRQLLQIALEGGQIMYSDLYRDDVYGHLHLEHVIPLPGAGGRSPLIALVLHTAPPERFLFPLLQTWPVPSTSAETLLVRRDGADVIFLNELRRPHGTALSLHLPLDATNPSATMTVSGSKPQVVYGVDYRGAAVLAATRPIAGTPWHLVAKIDREEVMAPLKTLIVWVSLVTLVAVIAIAVAIWWLWRQILHSQRLELDTQAATLRWENEARYRSLTENLSAMIYRADPHTGVANYVNPVVEYLCGYSVDEWLNNPELGKQAIHPDDRERVLRTILETQAKAKRGEVEYRIVHRNGTTRWVVDRFSWEKSATGQIVSLNGVLSDITKRKQAEDALRKFSLAIEQSEATIIITDINTTIEYVNNASIRSCGYRPDELVGQNPRILHSGKTPKKTYKALWAALAKGRPWKGEFINRRKDGREYVEFASITPLRQPDGRITHYVGVTEDITEKKHLGEELERYRFHLEDLVTQRTKELVSARQQAEVANRAKSAFLANMSHEIRTPMNIILGLTHLLRRASSVPKEIDRLDKIDSAGRHLLSIINDILDLSKIEADKLQLEQSDFGLNVLLDHVRAMMLDAAHAKGLTMEVNSGNVPLWLRGDLTRLRQALFNYAGNAVKFTEKGSIALRASLLAENGDELLVRFEVVDTGVGIDPGKIARLFQAFEQADVSTTRKHGGTGLGLAITRQLAHLMGGEAGADSTPGMGSTFWFTARLHRGQGVMPTVSTTPPNEAETTLRQYYGGVRILLAEDNAVNREVTVELLQNVGLTVETVADGREALERARNNVYDLVLMDMQMPEMDGMEATLAIRALPDWDQVPILAMTANALAEDRRACEAAGMNDFIVKPTEPATFYAVLLKCLSARAVGTSQKAVGTSIQSPDTTILPLHTTAPEAILAHLARIPGLNVKQGLAALHGKTARYWVLLRKFAESHAHDMTSLATSLAAGDHATARRLAHSIKGTAATLGVEQLSDRAGHLEAMLLANPKITPLDNEVCAIMDDINREFMTLLAATLSSSLSGSPRP